MAKKKSTPRKRSSSTASTSEGEFTATVARAIALAAKAKPLTELEEHSLKRAKHLIQKHAENGFSALTLGREDMLTPASCERLRKLGFRVDAMRESTRVDWFEAASC